MTLHEWLDEQENCPLGDEEAGKMTAALRAVLCLPWENYAKAPRALTSKAEQEAWTAAVMTMQAFVLTAIERETIGA